MSIFAWFYKYFLKGVIRNVGSSLFESENQTSLALFVGANASAPPATSASKRMSMELHSDAVSSFNHETVASLG